MKLINKFKNLKLNFNIRKWNFKKVKRNQIDLINLITNLSIKFNNQSSKKLVFIKLKFYRFIKKK